MKKILLITLLCLSGGAVPVTHGQNLHPLLVKDEKWIQEVAILPPDVSLVSSDGAMIAEASGIVSESLRAVVSEALRAQAIRVHTGYFTPEWYLRSSEATYTYADIQYLFDRMMPKLRRNTKQVRKGRFTLGDQVALLNGQSKADTFVFIHVQGEITPSRSTLGFIIKASSKLNIYISMVDAYTGDVLSFDKITSRGDIMADPEGVLKKPVRKYFRSVFKKLGY